MEVLSGGTPKTKVPDYWDGGIPFFTPKDVTDHAYVGSTEKTITEAGLKNCNSRLYPKDTVFITARGTVGKISLAQRPMAMNQSCYALVAKPPINQCYLYFALVDGVEQFRGRAVGAVFDAIIRDTFKLIPFFVPDETIIQAFTAHAMPILRQIDVLSAETQKLTKARDLLLPRLMNGEVTVMEGGYDDH
jgi:type I restriction enzyme S subunit